MERLIYHGQIFVQIVLYENYCTFCSILLQVVMFYWGMFRVCVWCFLDWVCLLSHSFITCLWANENERRHTCVWLMCLYGCEWEFSSVELFVCNCGRLWMEASEMGPTNDWVYEWMYERSKTMVQLQICYDTISGWNKRNCVQYWCALVYRVLINLLIVNAINWLRHDTYNA